jgi:hypothetical protein
MPITPLDVEPDIVADIKGVRGTAGGSLPAVVGHDEIGNTTPATLDAATIDSAIPDLAIPSLPQDVNIFEAPEECTTPKAVPLARFTKARKFARALVNSPKKRLQVRFEGNIFRYLR